MSSLIGGRSGNRGTCAGSCRLKYDVIDEKGKRLNSFWESSQFLKSKSDYMKSVNNFTMNIDENFKNLKDKFSIV